MILMNKEKIQIDGVDVYPDHAETHQFWMVPGQVRLAERNGDKALSYLWYIDDAADKYGTGFLSFEVNTAIAEDTRDRIRSAIAAAHPELTASKIRLSVVSYDRGHVNFSVLGPVAASAGTAKPGDGVLHQSAEQIVWSAGSSSLVGDNAAVCSVKFTKDGRLAAAMAQSIEEQANMIAATYSLEFTALRPAVTFNVKGKLSEVREGLKASVGAGIPLEAFMLNVGTSVNLEKIMRDVGLEITVVDFAGDEKTGLDWAKQIVMDHILKTFLQVDLGNGKTAPISKVPEVASMVQRAKDVSKQAEDKVPEKDKPTKPVVKPVVKPVPRPKAADTKPDEKVTLKPEGDKPKEDKPTGDKPKDDKPTPKPDPKPTPKPDAKEEAVKEVAKQAVAASLPLPIPQVNIQIDYSRQVQENSIDFTYSETKARVFTVAPQGLVLEDLANPSRHIVKFSRGQDPFGLPHPVNVTVPSEEAFKAYGLRAINLTARYPAGAPANKQQNLSATVTPGKFDGANPLPFTFDAAGSRAVEFDAEFVFDAASAWKASANTYKVQGNTDSGVDAQPGSHLGFLEVNVLLSENFVWRDADQVIVTLSGKDLSGPAVLVFQKGEKAPRKASFRTEARNPEASYEIQVKRGGVEVWREGPAPVIGNAVTVSDRYASHVPVKLRNSLKEQDFAVVTVLYADPDNDYAWESDEISIEKGNKDLPAIVIPTKKAYQVMSDLRCTVRVETADGAYEKEGKGGATFFVVDPPAGA